MTDIKQTLDTTEIRDLNAAEMDATAGGFLNLQPLFAAARGALDLLGEMNRRNFKFHGCETSGKSTTCTYSYDN